MKIDWAWAKLRAFESFRCDSEFRRAARHTTHQTLRHVDIRVERFLDEPPGVQRAVLLLLQRDRLTHEPGNRGIASSVLVTGLTSVATVITAVVAVILAAYLGFADQLTPEAIRADQDFLTVSLLWVAGALAAVLFAVTVVWLGGGQRDRRRAMSTLWLQIFTEAQNNHPDLVPHSEDDALRAWLQHKPLPLQQRV